MHMDEYIGISERHPASFRHFLREHLVDAVQPRAFYGMAGDASNVEGEMRRYAELVEELDPEVCVLGIGENGHLAFNDPPADFETDEPFIVVELDEACRRQQAGEGWFASPADVPARAISMSIRQIMRARTLYCMVPERRKAEAVRFCLEEEVSPMRPASILRQHPDAQLYLDRESASLLTKA